MNLSGIRTVAAKLRRFIFLNPVRQGSSFRITRILLISFIVLVLYYNFAPRPPPRQLDFGYFPRLFEQHPPDVRFPLPDGASQPIPKIQAARPKESIEEKTIRAQRLDKVKAEFLHAWKGYKNNAWTQDELLPISGGGKASFCGWAATLVDALDTLWIMELYDEFDAAVEQVSKIDFTGTEMCEVNLFETTIRHLGGLLAAYDVSGNQKKYEVLLAKAVELGELLYTAFDTSNRMPMPHFYWSLMNATTFTREAPTKVVTAKLGSLTLEFTRLSQLSRNPKWHSAAQNVLNELEAYQARTAIPGLLPSFLDATGFAFGEKLRKSEEVGGETYTLGALVDSTYEYLSKYHLLLEGRNPQPRRMYESFVGPAILKLLFRPMTMGEDDILIAGHIDLFPDHEYFAATLDHLQCFSGGMFALASKVFNRPQDLVIGEKLTKGCVWAYKSTASGVMPEIMTAIPCLSKKTGECAWNDDIWYAHVLGLGSLNDLGEKERGDAKAKISALGLAPGFASAGDPSYLLRPEAVESLFIMYRLTGDRSYMESAWTMFESVIAHTKTEIGHAAIQNVLFPVTEHIDQMESFWLAETLKYFYLCFAEWDVVDLDVFVLNTEAHPLRRPG